MTSYRHQLFSAIECNDQVGKIVCVGRNYADHAKELNNPIPQRPLLFIKPATAAVAMQEPLQLPQGQGGCHHELEMAILIGSSLTRATVEQAEAAIAGVGLALDLTLRDLQSQLKEKGHPWERAKSFDGACPISPFVKVETEELQNLTLNLWRNGELQQSGNTGQMLFPVLELLVDISAAFTLLPGDVVLTGTPAGVGPLQAGDQLRAALGGELEGNALNGAVLEIETSVLV